MKVLKILYSMLVVFSGVWLFLLATPAFSSPVVIDKNLFSPDRKPPPPDSGTPAAQSNTPTVPPKTLQLDGIFIHGNTKKALVRMKGQVPGKDKGKENSPFISVREGEKVSDYVVSKIGLKSISVEKGGQTFEIYLYASGKVLPPLAAPPPPQPGNEPVPGGPRGQRPIPDQPPQAPGEAGAHSAEQMHPDGGGGNVGNPPPPIPRQRPNVSPPMQTQAPDEEGDADVDQEENDGEQE